MVELFVLGVLVGAGLVSMWYERRITRLTRLLHRYDDSLSRMSSVAQDAIQKMDEAYTVLRART